MSRYKKKENKKLLTYICIISLIISTIFIQSVFAPPSGEFPVAIFSWSPDPGIVYQNVTFDASASYDPDGGIYQYNWDFGDGSTGSGEMVDHAYSSHGSFFVTLTVIDFDGLEDIVSHLIMINNTPDENLPLWKNQSQNKSYIFQNQTISLSCKGMDDTALDWAWLATNETGVWQNHTYENSEWWNTSWGYRRLINIRNAVNGYQMKISIGFNSSGDVSCNEHCQPDFDDVRFIDYNTDQELSYWLESFSETDNAVFWVKTPDDIESSQRIWLYYGNNNSNSMSNGSDTFILFDGSEDGNADEWVCWSESLSSCDVSASTNHSFTGNFSTYIHQYDCCCGSNHLVRTYRDWNSDYNISNQDLVFEYRVYPVEPSGEDTLVSWMKGDNNNYGDFVTQNANLWRENDPHYDDIREFGFQTYKNYFMWNNLNEWHHVVLRHNGVNKTATGVLYDASGNNVHDEINMNISSIMDADIVDRFMVQTGRWCHNGDNRIYFDNILIRNWTSDGEPICYSFVEEENQSDGDSCNYNSLIKMQENNEWQWANFTWQNSSLSINPTIGWRIYFMDTSGNINKTDIMSFFITVPPTANFTFPNEDFYINSDINFTDLSNDSDGAITSWYWDFGDDNTSYQQHPIHNYSLPGNYTISLTVEDNHGATDTFSLNITILDLMSINHPLLDNWNLITIAVENNMWASGVCENITGSISFSRWNNSMQTYDTYIVGGPPSFDFPIEDGWGYFVDLNQSSNLTLTGPPIDSVNVSMLIGWNLIGWYKSENTTASSIAQNITGSLSVSRWNATMQTYDTYIVGGPPSFDFTVTQGMGLFVDVTEESFWYGEG